MFFQKNNSALLCLFWLLVPIIRVSLPGTSIYGGIRQIFEFVPALALLAGYGASQLSTIFKKTVFIKILFILVFIYPINILVKLHPYENVYFNSLIGGLPGAKARNFPSWGNSFGSAYKQGLEWLNKNAPENSKLALIQGTPANAPAIWLRPDIDFKNSNWSGINRNGEYLMDLYFNDSGKSFFYSWEYVDKFLEPVYEIKVDGIAILKIWKNDLEHTKEEYRLSEKLLNNFSVNISENNLLINLKDNYSLSKLELLYATDNICSPIKEALIETSLDNNSWQREKDWIPFPQVGSQSNLDFVQNKINFYFANRSAHFIKLIFDNKNSCAFNLSSIKIFILDAEK